MSPVGFEDNKEEEEEEDIAEDDAVLLLERLREEAKEAVEDEPELSGLLNQTILAPCVNSFEDAVARAVCHRLFQQQQQPCFCPNAMLSILTQAFASSDQELGHSMSQAVRRDVWSVLERDPACNSLLEVILFYKGFAALVCHRAARYKWFLHKRQNNKTSKTALFLQSQASAVFGVDIHPAATMGAAIFLDHGTGIVIGETAVVGDGCTLLHGVTLGGTGKDTGDRHPKIGPYTLIGAGASILGNIHIGRGCKIGAGSVVLRAIPSGATAVGAPAKIIGHAKERRPSILMDDSLQQVALLHKFNPIAAMEQSSGTMSFLSSVSETMSENQEQKQENKPEQEPEETNPATCRENAKVFRENIRRKYAARRNDSEDNNNQDEDRDEEDKFSMCPFREYARIKAPPGAWNMCQFKQWLYPHGVPMEEIQALFFALDGTRNVGYVYWKDLIDVCDTILPTSLSCLSSDARGDNNKESQALLQTLRKEIPTPPIFSTHVV